MRPDSFEAAHIQHGRNMIRVSGEPDLEDNAPLWRALWERHRDGLMSEWIARSPGSRPRAWHEFDCGQEPGEDEAEVEFLSRIGELSAGELEAIRRKAVQLAGHDRCRDPRPTAAGFYASNFIPPDDIHRFAARKGLLTAEDLEALGLDAQDRPGNPGENRENHYFPSFSRL